MTIPSELVSLVDSRVLKYMQQPIAMGTLVTRDSTGAGGSVTFDSDATAVPIKVAASVHVFPPDRVLMVRVIGSGLRQPDLGDTRKPSPGEWVVIAGFTQRDLSGTFVMSRGTFSGPGPGTNITTFGSMVDVPDLAFVKWYDNTRVRLTSDMGTFSNTVGCGVEIAMQIDGTDYPVGNYQWSSGIHMVVSGFNLATGVPAGLYNVATRWRRTGVSGGIGANNADVWHVSAEEIA